MQPSFEDDFGIDIDDAIQEEEIQNDDFLSENSIDMEDYGKSLESDVSNWRDIAQDVIIQPALGSLKYYTWPLDLMKLAMVGEGLEGVDELENAAFNAGVPFDRAEYLKNVAETSEFIPTQQLLEDLAVKVTGVDLAPKTDIGKSIRKFFTLVSLTKGGVGGKIASGATGVAVTEGAKSAGIPETASEFLGDIGAGFSTALKTSPRKLAPEIQSMQKVADKHGLPFLEVMAKEPKGIIKPKVSQATESILKKDLGLSTEEAINKIINGELPVSRLRDSGVNIDNLVSHAYEETRKLARANPQKMDMAPLVKNIDREISQIKGKAPSPSDADLLAIQILESERDILGSSSPTSEQLINQNINYNSNLKSIYRKPEFTGRENGARIAYEKLKQANVNVMETQGQSDVANSFRASNGLFNQNARMIRSEGLIQKAFKNGEYNPKTLDRVLNSKQGSLLERDLGKDAIKEIKEISKFGNRAQQRITQLGKNSRNHSMISSWGPMAPLILTAKGKMRGFLAFGKPAAEYIKGQLLTRPATRTVYNDIIKNASKGSFNLLKGDFDKLNEEISKEWGSVDEFIEQVVDDLEIWSDED